MRGVVVARRDEIAAARIRGNDDSVRVFNFSAGPAQLPLPVLEQAASELTSWGGSGMSVLEVSHRGADFVACAADAEATLRRLLSVPDNYRVLFLQGGASAQFAGIPLNLTAPGDTVAYLNTGQWSAKAIKQAGAYELDVVVPADEAASSYTTTPEPGSFTVPEAARYLHYTPNETTILSRPIDVSRYGLIYAGAQKNMGPSGLAVVIVREDLLGRARPVTPTVLDYQKMADADSMLNTPPTFAIYLLGLIGHWIEDGGGLEAMAERNRAKAELLYGYIDSSDFYANPVQERSRSWMNVPFTLADPARDADFLAGAEAAGLTNLKGHRSVGGMRASIYNAMPIEGVRALIDYMTDFAARA